MVADAYATVLVEESYVNFVSSTHNRRDIVAKTSQIAYERMPAVFKMFSLLGDRNTSHRLNKADMTQW